MEDQLQSTEAEVEELASKLALQEDALTEETQEHEATQDERDALAKHKQELEEQLAKHQQDLESHKELLKQKEEVYDDLITQHASEKQLLDEQVEKHKTEKEQLQQERDHVLNAQQETQKQQEELKHAFEDATQHIEKMKKQADSDAREQAREILARDREIEKLKTQLEMRQQQASKMEERLSVLDVTAIDQIAAAGISTIREGDEEGGVSRSSSVVSRQYTDLRPTNSRDTSVSSFSFNNNATADLLAHMPTQQRNRINKERAYLERVIGGMMDTADESIPFPVNPMQSYRQATSMLIDSQAHGAGAEVPCPRTRNYRKSRKLRKRNSFLHTILLTRSSTYCGIFRMQVQDIISSRRRED